MNPDRDANHSVGGGATLLAALRTRQIDAFHLSTPTPNRRTRQVGVVVIKGSAGDVPELDNFLYTGVRCTTSTPTGGDLLRRWTKAVNRANKLMRQDQAAAVSHCASTSANRPGGAYARAPRHHPGALGRRMMTEQCWRHLQFMLEDGQISASLGKEGLLWTNRYIVK
jgi:ABC-type nitrate/sulfonate/bicarbonate transport system substrate-binding protein